MKTNTGEMVLISFTFVSIKHTLTRSLSFANWSDLNPFVICIYADKEERKWRQLYQKNEKGRAHFHLQFMLELGKTAWGRIMNDKFLLESK